MSDTIKNHRGWLLVLILALLVAIAIWVVAPAFQIDGQFPLASATARAFLIAGVAVVCCLAYFMTNANRNDTAEAAGNFQHTELEAAYSQPEREQATSSLSRHLGCYGYSAHQKDIVAQNLPQVFMDTWHDWASSQMIYGSEMLGKRWVDTYGDSQSHRFIWSSGIAGNNCWAGLMIPSKNSEGEQFPFCVAAALPFGSKPILAINKLDRWFEDMEELANELLDEQFSDSRLAEKLKEFSANSVIPDSTTGESEFIAGVPDATGQLSIRSAVVSGQPAKNVHNDLLDAVMQQTFFQYSVWLTSRNSASTESNTVLSAGLPVKDQGLALFSGDWLRSGCGNLIGPGVAISDAERQVAMNGPDQAETSSNTMRNNLVSTINKLTQTAEVNQNMEQTRLMPASKKTADANAPKPSTTPWKI